MKNSLGTKVLLGFWVPPPTFYSFLSGTNFYFHVKLLNCLSSLLGVFIS